MEQGRVQTDADWNELLAEQSRRARAGTLDALGHVFYPAATTPYAFQIAAFHLRHDELAQLIGLRPCVSRWDRGREPWPSQDRRLGPRSRRAFEYPAAAAGHALIPLDSTNSIPFTSQPHASPSSPVPSGDGPYLAYLDAWQRPVTVHRGPRAHRSRRSASTPPAGSRRPGKSTSCP